MKQALVLGLALAANAMTADQVDSELFVAPTGGKFGDLAKFPGKMGKIMFDEQADDELLALNKRFEESKGGMPSVLHPSYYKDEKKRFEESKGGMSFLHRPQLKPKRPEEISYPAGYKAADDEELFVAPQGKLADLAKKYPGMIMFDEQADHELHAKLRPRVAGETEEQYQAYLASRRTHFSRDDAADDEFALLLPRSAFKNNEEFEKYYALVRYMDAADDELLIRPLVAADDDEFMVRLLPRESFQTEEEYQKYVAKMRFHRDDEELFVAPEGKLGEFAKKYPGKIMFDEADDELRTVDNLPRDEFGRIVRPPYARFDEVDDDEFMVRLLPRDAFQTEEEYQKYLAKWVFHRDDEELFVAPQGKLGELAKKYPGKIMFDEQADDELIAMIPPRDKFKSEEEYQRFIALVRKSGSRDDAADDEFALLLPRSAFKSNEEFEKYYALVRYMDAADDELRAIDNLPRDEFGRIVRPPYARFDEQADDELLIRPVLAADDDEFMVRLLPRESFQTEEEYQKYVAKMRFHRDDEELFIAPEGKLGELAKKYPGKIMFDEQADDELSLIPVRPKVFADKGLFKPAKIATSEAWVRGDDEADDELVYLGQLIRHAEIAAAHTFDDDELRAEKPSHVKAQEKAQFKAELPKMKRKLRPVDETAFLA